MWLSYLLNIPNKVVLRNIAQKFDKEYNPKARIQRSAIFPHGYGTGIRRVTDHCALYQPAAKAPRSGYTKKKQYQGAEKNNSKEEEEILLAIATALHLHNNFPEGEDRITWKSHGDMESPWLVSGRMHTLNRRKHPNSWNSIQ